MEKLTGPCSVSVEVVVDLGDLLKHILNHLAKPVVLKSKKLTRNFEINIRGFIALPRTVSVLIRPPYPIECNFLVP